MSETRSYTHGELASALGIGTPSARNLVRRKRLQWITGNDKLARIVVLALRAALDAVRDERDHMPTQVMTRRRGLLARMFG